MREAVCHLSASDIFIQYYNKTAFDVSVSTNDKQYLIFLAGKSSKFLEKNWHSKDF